MNGLFYVLMSIVVMVRKKKEQENDRPQNRYDGKMKGKREKKRLFLLLCDLGTCNVSRPINKKRKEHVLCIV
jgi:hypothetical protein